MKSKVKPLFIIAIVLIVTIFIVRYFTKQPLYATLSGQLDSSGLKYLIISDLTKDLDTIMLEDGVKFERKINIDQSKTIIINGVPIDKSISPSKTIFYFVAGREYILNSNKIMLNYTTLLIENSPESTYFKNYYNEEFVSINSKEYYSRFKLDWKDFKQSVESNYDMNIKYIDSVFLANKDLHKDFVNDMHKEYKYQLQQEYLHFEKQHFYYKKIALPTLKYTDIDYPEDYQQIKKEILSNFNINDDNNKYSIEYQKLSEVYLEAKAFDELIKPNANLSIYSPFLKGTISEVLKYAQVVNETVENRDYAQKLIHQNTKSFARLSSIDDDLKQCVEFYEREKMPEKYLTELKKIIESKTASTILEGQNNKGFNFYQVNGSVLNLNNFKGRYVYIDIWATWCGPCKFQEPFFKQLAQEFTSKGIQFLSISIDKDQEAWEKAVKDKNDSITYVIVKEIDQFKKAYGIKGIPCFILIDKNGIILKNPAIMPAQSQIHDFLENLL